MRNIKETTTRVIILFIGLVIAHFGVTLFLLANLGTDPFNVLIQGLYKLTSGLAGGAVPMPIRLGANVLGCVILAFGMTIVIKSDAGTGPNDLVAIVISDKLGKKFSITRIIVDVAFAAIGASLGGTFGIGTVICAFVVGPVAGFFLPINGRIIEKMVGRG